MILPGGKAMLFTVVRGDDIDESDIAVQPLEGGQHRILVEGGTHPRYVPTGHLVYTRSGTLMAVPFDLAKLEISASPFAVVDDVTMDPGSGVAHFDFSNDGTLFYISGQWTEPQRRLAWVSRNGEVAPLPMPPRAYEAPALSPDGKRVVVGTNGANADLWSYAIERGTLTRLTTHRAEDLWPIWSQDGQTIFFTSYRDNLPVMYRKRSDPGDPEQPVLRKKYERYVFSSRPRKQEYARFPASCSPDGKHLLFVEDTLAESGFDIWSWSESGEPKPFLQTSFDENQPAFSPSGRWVAYTSNESGASEIYIRPFPAGDRVIQISTEGGKDPVWARDHEELYYRDGDKMMAVPYSAGSTFLPETPVLLFEKRHLDLGIVSRTDYDVTPDGKRFLVVLPDEESSTVTQINVIVNWFEELERLVPTGNLR